MSIEKLANEISNLFPVFLRNMYPYVFGPIDVPPSQLIALISIEEKSKCTMTDLKNLMHVSAPTVSGIVDRLERDGYIQRVPSKEDRRVTYVQLTQNGIKIIKKFRANIQKRWEYILSKMPDELGETQVHILKHITSGFKDGSI